MHVQRFDRSARLTRVDATPQGGIAATAYLARTGVLTYTRADGSTIREYRAPSEVFDAKALASAKGAPITIGHPRPGMVTPSNYKDLSVGHVGDDVRAEGGRFVAATVRVNDANAVEGIKSGDLIELSAGYTVDVVPRPGVSPEGEPYDAVQTNLKINHIALLPPGGGRSGSQVALKLDANDAIEIDTAHEDAKDPITAARNRMNAYRGGPRPAETSPRGDEDEDAGLDPIQRARNAMLRRDHAAEYARRADARRAPETSEDTDEDPIAAARARMLGR